LGTTVTDNATRPLNETIIRVRKLSQARLARYSQLEPIHCKEIYLFQNEQFCGIRFHLGPFQADWRIDQTEVHFLREGSQIGLIELDPTSTKRAA
jgi:hypothetical protein